MKTLIVYKSIHHGNTKKIALAMAEVLKAETAEADKVTPEKLADFNLIGFGSGIYGWKHHASLLKLAESLMPTAKNGFIFSTRGAGAKGHGALRRRLIKKGFKILDEFTCKGWDTFGPFKLTGGINRGRPNEDDIEKAKTFARKIKTL